LPIRVSAIESLHHRTSSRTAVGCTVDNQQVQKGRITGLKQKSKITYNKRHLKPATDLECCYCRLTPSWDNSIPCYL